MPVFLGGKKWRVCVNGTTYNVHTIFKNVNVSGYALRSSDDYLLQDSNGLYLTTTGYGLLSADNKTLRDYDGLYLTVKETDNYGY